MMGIHQFPEDVCVWGGRRRGLWGCLFSPTHTNWFGHPCTRLALLGELAWSGHQVGRGE